MDGSSGGGGRPGAAVSSGQLLGYAADARVLLVNCDDFGMYEAVNLAVVDCVERGIATSCSLMAPCPAAGHGLRLLRERPEIPFGIHLTLVRDTQERRWGPLSPRSRVPSLLDGSGEFFTPAGIPRLLARARLDEVATELRAQIDYAVGAGLAPTHLDWHCIADGGRPDIWDLTLALAAEYGLAARCWLDPARGELRERGLPATDHPFLDSFSLPTRDKPAAYAALLRDLPAGLTEWAVHPALPTDQARALDDGWRVRTSDHAFLTSEEAAALVRTEGVELADYRAVQGVWAARRRGDPNGGP